MAINLATKYADKIAEAFTAASFLKGRVSGDYDWTGVKTVKVYTPQTVAMGDYTRSGTSRYGTPTEVQDIVQDLVLTKDRAFSLTVDKGNNTEQMGVKNAGKVLNMQIRERMVPDADTYAFTQFVNQAGTIVGISAPSKTTIFGLMTDAQAALDDALVPAAGRTVYAPASITKLMLQSGEVTGLEGMGAKAVGMGYVGEMAGFEIVKVPASYLPTNCYFLCTYKNSVLHPIKLNDTKLHIDPPGLSGHLLEGRNIFDAFVLGAKCMGVYAAVASASKLATPTVTAGALKFTIAGTASTSCKYTTDGTDPRYSSTATTTTGTASYEVAAAAGAVTVKAVTFASGKFPSDVVTSTVTVTAE